MVSEGVTTGSAVYYNRRFGYVVSTAWSEAGFEVHEMNLEVVEVTLGRDLDVRLVLHDPNGQRWVVKFGGVQSVSWDSGDDFAFERPPDAAGEISGGYWVESGIFDIQCIDGELLVAAAAARTVRVDESGRMRGPGSETQFSQRGRIQGTGEGSCEVSGDGRDEQLASDVWRRVGLEWHDLTLHSVCLGLDSEFRFRVCLRDPRGADWLLEFDDVLSVSWDLGDGPTVGVFEMDTTPPDNRDRPRRRRYAITTTDAVVNLIAAGATTSLVAPEGTQPC